MKRITSILIFFLVAGLLQPRALAVRGVATYSYIATYSRKLTQLKQIALKHPQGFTVYVSNLQSVKKGWCVGMLATQNSFGDAGLRKALKIAESTTQIIGGWKSGKLFYWDAVMVFNNKQNAIKAGIKNRQLSIYNIETAQTINLKSIHKALVY